VLNEQNIFLPYLLFDIRLYQTPARRIPGGNLSSSFVIPDLIGTSVFSFHRMPVEPKKTRQDE
jgi:hypothetical protein